MGSAYKGEGCIHELRRFELTCMAANNSEWRVDATWVGSSLIGFQVKKDLRAGSMRKGKAQQHTVPDECDSHWASLGMLWNGRWWKQ